MENNPLKIALIGCGAVAENYYVPALNKLSATNNIAIRAVFDPVKSHAEKLQRQFPTCDILSTVSEIDPLKIDLAIVASPAGCHAEQSIELLKYGCAVLCEKPMAPTVAQCQAMIEAATLSGSLLYIGHLRRQFPAALAIKEILQSNLLGQARAFKFSEGSPFQWPAASRSLFNKTEAGGGVLMDLGVHMLDLALWWFGEVVSLSYKDDAMGGVEANCRLQLNFKNGASGVARLSRDWWLDNNYTIECDKGTISWNITQATNIEVKQTDGSTRKAIDDLLDKRWSGKSEEPAHLQAFFNQLKAVVESVSAKTANTEDLVSGVEAKKSLELIESCYAQDQLMSMPWLTDPEVKRAYELRQSGGHNRG